MENLNIRALFPSDDGNLQQRNDFIELVKQIVEGVDALKDPEAVHLKGTREGAAFLSRVNGVKPHSGQRKRAGSSE